MLRKVIGTACHPLRTYRWLQLLKAHPLLREVADIYPALLSKIHRPYFSRRLGCAERIGLLTAHYDFMLAAGCADLVRQATPHPTGICAFAGKSGVLYRIELGGAGVVPQAGELALRLISRGICVYTVSFVFGREGDQPCIAIGGLTGMLSDGRSFGIKQVTRDLYGCRPRELMVSLVREIGYFFGCERVLLVGSRNRVRSRGTRECRKSANYDLTWNELDAAPIEDGNFWLPCAPASLHPFAPRADRFQKLQTPSKRSVLVASILRSLRRRLAAEQAGAAADCQPLQKVG